VLASWLAILVAATLSATPGLAAVPCATPPAFDLHVEQRGVTEHDGPGLVATASGGVGGLSAGDRVRQANGARVERCADLERVAAEALARGLALLLGVERAGGFVAVAARLRSAAELARVETTNDAAVAAGTTTRVPTARDSGERNAEPAAGGGRADEAPAAAAVPTPIRHAETALPAKTDASATLRQRAGAAARTLATLDENASLSVPLVVYDRRLHEAEAAIVALEFPVESSAAAVRRFVEDVLEYHRTAAEVRRTKLQALSDRRIDRRASPAAALPYFSDSRVPEWIASYPFLEVAVLQTPRETRMLLPGEVAGRWDPDRALDLLWTRAREGRARLAAWAQ
jgi:hypothetical protein